MSDKELLELASKAAGIVIDMPFNPSLRSGHPIAYNLLCVLNEKGGHDLWNPLTDDGDALRLAVKLKLDVECLGDATQVNFTDGKHNTRHFNVGKDEGCNGDPYAATRRAIVRAAAEIGKAMP